MNKKTLITILGASKSVDFIMDCPAITPTYEATIITNGDMELDSDWADSNTPTTNVRSDEQAQAGTYSRKIEGSSNKGAVQAGLAALVGRWYFISGYGFAASGAVKLLTNIGSGSHTVNANIYGASWQRVLEVVRNENESRSMFLYAAVTGTSGYLDSVVVNPITLATCLTALKTRTKKTGTYICKPTVTEYTQAGIAIEYEDADNFVLLYTDGINAKVDKCVGGTWSTVITGAITYQAGLELKVTVDGSGNHALYYDGTQIGSTTAITDVGLGYQVLGFSTYATNTVGEVRVNFT